MNRRIILPIVSLLILPLLSGQSAAPPAAPAASGDGPAASRPADRPRRANAQQRDRRAQAAAATRPATAPANRANRGRAESLGQPKPGGDGPVGKRLTGESLYNVQPAVLPREQHSNWLAWVGYLPGAGDFLFVGIEQSGEMRDIVRLTETPADLFRPVLVRSGDTALLLFTQTVAGKGPQIFFSKLQSQKWSEPQILPDAAPHTFNPEAAALPDGRIAIVYQVFSNGAYAIGLRTYEAGKWSAETRIAEPGTDDGAPLDCWDPVAAWDSASGRLMIAWTAFFPGDYDLCWRTWADGRLGRTERITRIGYDLHPSAVAAPDGGVWVAWDNIQIAGHAGSGRTFIKHPRDESIDLGPRTPRLQCSVWAARWADGKWTTPATGGRVTGQGEDVRHGGSPKMVFDATGRLHIAYRTHHEPVSGRTLYFWDISTRTLDGDRWSDPIRLADSDGPTEEPALASAGDNFLVFFQRDYRRTKGGNDGVQLPRLANEHLEKFFTHHCDYGDPKTRHGDIFVTPVPGQGAPPRTTQALAVDPPVRKEYKTFEPYRKGEYTVFFGDLHRHTNVSRCSRGAEPDPDDHYRYSRDVCRYDFLGISDHASHTSDYNWWRLQKLADLYYTPGDFTTLFGVEWNGPEGHKNVMSPSRHLPLLATTGVAPNALTLWDELAKSGVPAITIPHSSSLPGQDADWSKHDPRFERLVEIFQACRGSFEGKGAPRQFPDATLDGQHVQDALAKGYRLGIICSTDHGYGASYACVYAKENTRAAVFDALQDRRTYGSTAYGIIVDFNVNGVMMGRDVKRSDGNVIVSGYVRGNSKLDRVQILKDNKVVHEWTPSGDEQKLDWRDPDPGTGLHWYYLRVIQEDDEMAWSSPNWVVD